MSVVTLALLKKLFPGTPNSDINRFVEPFNTILPKYDVTTKERFNAFIANAGIESDHLKALEEYASGSAYEGRKNLGNVRQGDGKRYKGRSVLQTTGRYNYWKVVVAYLRVLTGKNWHSNLAETDFDAYLNTQEYTDLLAEADKYNVNFLAHPELLAQFPHAVEAAGVFIKDNHLNDYADNGNIFAYSGILNKGSASKRALAYSDRKAIYDLANKIVPDDFELGSDEPEPTPVKPDVNPVDPVTPPDSNNGGNGNVTQNVDVTDNQNVVVAPPKPQPQDDPITIKAVTTSIWAKIVAGITILTGMGINTGEILQAKLENINLNQLLVLVLGSGLVVLAVFYYKKRQESADDHNKLMMVLAGDTEKNTVQLDK
jgi:predicted chitinase